MIGIAIAMMLAGAGLGWHPFTNAKYGYTTCYPSQLLHAQREADAGDGRVFTSHDGTELRAWGSYASATETTLARETAALERDLTGPHGVVSYKVNRANWTVMSGRSGNKVFWAKIGQRDDRIVVVELIHPASALTRYRALPAELNRCSSIGTAPF